MIFLLCCIVTGALSATVASAAFYIVAESWLSSWFEVGELLNFETLAAWVVGWLPGFMLTPGTRLHAYSVQWCSAWSVGAGWYVFGSDSPVCVALVDRGVFTCVKKSAYSRVLEWFAEVNIEWVYYALSSLWTYAMLIAGSILVITCLVFLAAVLLAVWYFNNRRVSHVSTDYTGVKSSVVAVKSYFSKAVKSLNPVISGADDHVGIAAERRNVEKICMRFLAQCFTSVRDVGGSRGRDHSDLFPDGHHKCMPQLSGFDAVRDQNATCAYGCRNLGSDCPQRLNISAAVMTHSDYYMTQDQMIRTITGPTFIITHIYPDSSSWAKLCEEMEYRYVGTEVEVKVRASQGYRHPVNIWADQGVCVSKSGAFSYARVCKYGSTTVIYCEPLAVRNYKLNSADNLRRSTEWATSVLSGSLGDAVLRRTFSDDTLSIEIDGELHVQSLSGDVLRNSALAIAVLPDGDGRSAAAYAQAKHFTATRLKATKTDRNLIEYWVLHVLALANVMSDKIAVADTAESFIGKTWLRRQWMKSRFWVNAKLRETPAAFTFDRAIKIPTLIVTSDGTEKPFRLQGEDVDGTADRSAADIPRPRVSQHGSESETASIEPACPPAAVVQLESRLADRPKDNPVVRALRPPVRRPRLRGKKRARSSNSAGGSDTSTGFSEPSSPSEGEIPEHRRPLHIDVSGYSFGGLSTAELLRMGVEVPTE